MNYAAVLKMVPSLHATRQYDVILHVGVGPDSGLKIERLAHKSGYDDEDADGQLCAGPIGNRGFGSGCEGLGEELTTSVDVDGVVEHLRSKDLKVGIITESWFAH